MISEQIAVKLLKALKFAVTITPHHRPLLRGGECDPMCFTCRADALIKEAEAPAVASRDFAIEQIRRFEGRMGFPKMEPAFNDLCRELQASPDAEIALMAMSEALEGDLPCPTASTMKRLVLEALERRDGPLCWDVNCEQCSGSGFLNQGRGPKCNCLKRRKVNRYKQEVAIP